MGREVEENIGRMRNHSVSMLENGRCKGEWILVYHSSRFKGESREKEPLIASCEEES